MRHLALALAVVGLVAGPALANQCPLLIKQVMDATAGKTDDASKKAQTLANEAKALHDAGKHAESVQKAKAIFSAVDMAASQPE